MNKHLDKAIFGIGKVDALMHSIEQLYLDFEVMPEEQERLNRGDICVLRPLGRNP